MYFESLYIISGNILSGIMSANNGALDISNAPGVSVCSGNAYFSSPEVGDPIIHASAMFYVNICNFSHARNTAYSYWTGDANF